MTSFFLRPFLHADLPEATDLWVAAWQAAMPSIDFETRRGWITDRLTEMLERGVSVFAAFDITNGSMAGFVTIDPMTGWLDQIAVSRTHQGTGAARDLIGTAKAFGPGLVRLDVNVDNPRAIRFYEREGFRKTGEGVNPASGLKTITMEWRP